MKADSIRRYAVVALALVVAFSIVSPAVGGPSPLKIAKKALKKAGKANKKAGKANKKAKAADSKAGNALALGQTNAGEIKTLKDQSPALKCPEGMVKTADLCYEGSDRPATDPDTAVYTCANIGRRLPSVAEGLLMVAHLQPLDANSGGPSYFTDDYQGDFPRFVRIVNGSLGVGSTNQVHPFRCVTTPSL